MPKTFPFYKQHDAMDCGATCLRMVARHYGRFYSLEYLRQLTHQRKEGVSLLEISDAADHIGLHTLAAKVSFDRLRKMVPLPSIVHWRQNHYVVLYDITDKFVAIADPSIGLLRLSKEEFLDGWISTMEDGESVGVVLMLEPTPDFFQKEGDKTNKGGFGYIYQYLSNYRGLIFQLALGVLLSAILLVIFPFLIQALVDEGISSQDFNFVLLILLAWLMLFGSQMLIEHIRGWILLHLGVRVNINLISDFLIKVLKLPIRFFDQRMTSDLLNRIYDNERVERLLTTNSLFTAFSAVSIVLLGGLLLYFDLTIFLIFLIGTGVYLAWVLRFMKARKELDYKRFDQAAENQIKLVEMINGMQEIKLHNAETQKRWEWERTEAKLFRVGMNYLAVNQRQRLGAQIITEVKNILITIFAARAVIQGQMSLGSLLAVQYIIGQLNPPVNQLVEFFRATQDAKISLERMNEVHLRENEENPERAISILPENGDIRMEGVTYKYGGEGTPPVLSNLSLEIPRGKTTAIVGSSGSGKTTLLKLLLNIYPPTSGSIKLGDINISNFHSRLWREKCGAVLQDGYVFSDSIARNIALGDEIIDDHRLVLAAKVAHIQSFIETLPLGYHTKIGAEGVGLSQGQRQRILIARAVYKNPDYLFFDEATNALDSQNEAIIIQNIREFFKGRTVVMVAHRLSTVRHADHIIVLGDGRVVEQGNHDQLNMRKGVYFHLLQNQL
ncbi:MAG: peptidase domain-containing ABC transporter [Saprospiraceae bacterium]|nr:peptidase domain-containing ABC transporter [Saprospiraceae bacterium]